MSEGDPKTNLGNKNNTDYGDNAGNENNSDNEKNTDTVVETALMTGHPTLFKPYLPSVSGHQIEAASGGGAIQNY